MSKPEEAQELQTSTKTVERCGVCKPPEDVGENHPHLPNLLDILKKS